MRAFNPERQLHRIEEAFGGAMTRLTEFRLLPACGIRNLGWTTNQACSVSPVDGSEQAPAITRGGVDLRKLTLALPTPKVYPCPRVRTDVPLPQFVACGSDDRNQRTTTASAGD